MASDKVDTERKEMTPFLLRIFYRTGSSHSTNEFLSQNSLPENLTIYTWANCTLRELSSHIAADSTILPAKSLGTRLVFRLVYPDAKAVANANAPANFIARDIGSVVLGKDRPSVTDYTTIMNDNRDGLGIESYDDLDMVDQDETMDDQDDGRPGRASDTIQDDGDMMLQEVKFVIGDYVSVAILPPAADGSIAEAPVIRPQRSAIDRPLKPIDAGFGGAFGGEILGGRRKRGRGRGGNSFSGINTIPLGEWRRGERIPDAPRGGGRRGKRW